MTAKRPDGYWKKYYAEHREEKLAASNAYGRKRAIERPEERKLYMKEYYREHPEKWKSTEEKLEERRKKARERYATNEAHREKVKEAARIDGAAHPERKLKGRLRKYGLTIENYYELAEQGCAICGQEANSGDSRNYHFHIDHDHSTGEFRGLLCSACNLGLGKFKDNAELLEKAAKYLREVN